LVGILARRLSRKLCPACKQPYTPEPEEIQALAEEYCMGTTLIPGEVLQRWHMEYGSGGGMALYSAGKCQECDDSGYRGRVGLYEFLEATPVIKRLLQQRATVEALQAAALSQGMRTLKQAGIERVLNGETNIFAIRAVCS
ncbi:MAG: pilus assembly protein PilB, partial [Gallionella sp.]|nr:pilus assembly protein PilB [Gallionella sp.]